MCHKHLHLHQPGKRIGLLLLPLLFWLIPTSSLEHGPTLCLYTLITGRHCIGCGMLRALSCLIHGNLTRSWNFNHLVVIVAPLLAYVWITELAKTWPSAQPFLTGPVSLPFSRFYSRRRFRSTPLQ